MKLKKSELKRIIVEEINAVLAETDALPDEIKKKRKKEREKETKKRQDSRKSRERAVGGRGAFHGYDDAPGGLQSLARGIVEKERKPNCEPGNPFHDEDGRLTDPTKAKGSWSIAKDGPHGSDCQSGQSRRPSASRKQVFTKIKCGRGEGGKGKAKYKCKDGTPSHTPSSELTEDESWLLIEPHLQDQLDEQGQRLDCRACWKQFLQALNSANLAAKGDLYKK
jgi:hypothetical protein